MNFTNNSIYKRILPIAFFISFLLFWEFCVFAFNIPNYLLPSPSKIITQFILNFSSYYNDVLITLFESLAGLLLSVFLGLILSFIFINSKTLENGLFPYVIALKSLPVIAIAPLFIVWFGNGLLPKILISSIISFFPIVVNVVKGLSSVEQEAIDLFNILSASKYQILRKLRFKVALPYFFASLKMSSTLSVIGAIVGEFAGSDKGIGFRIIISSHRLETLDMFIGILLSSVLGIGLYYIVVLLEKLFIPWQKEINN